MHLVIIGGGVAGIAAADALYNRFRKDDDIHITLVEPKSYIDIPWTALRAQFDTNMLQSSTLPISNFIAKHPAIRHVQGWVHSITRTGVMLHDGRTLPYEFCIVATGAEKSFDLLNPHKAPTVSDTEQQSIQARHEALTASGAELLAAKSVLVVGGGAIGTELAADIAAYAAERNTTKPSVTLVHSRPSLVRELWPSSAGKLLSMCKSLDVNVQLNDKAFEKDGHWFLDSSKDQIPAEITVPTVGVNPANDLMKDYFPQTLDEKGWIKVDDNFRVIGCGGKIFAVGDCCDALDKTGVNAMGNKHVIARNVAMSIEELRAGRHLENLSGLSIKVKAAPVFVVTVGPNMGLAQVSSYSTTWVLPRLKNKTMFMFHVRGELGV